MRGSERARSLRRRKGFAQSGERRRFVGFTMSTILSSSFYAYNHHDLTFLEATVILSPKKFQYNTQKFKNNPKFVVDVILFFQI
jgi:hypothetical protein